MYRDGTRAVIAVHFHLYYREQLDEFLEKLGNLDAGLFDLFVTMVRDDESVVEAVRTFKPDARVKVVGNRGYDIGPFIDFLNEINLDRYDYVLKLHTKGRTWADMTKTDQYWIRNRDWARLLVDALLKDGETIRRNLDAFEKDSSVAMIGSDGCRCSSPRHYAELLPKINEVLARIGVAPVARCEFIGGSMFMARARIFKPLRGRYRLEDFEPSDGRVKEGLLAHAMERVFGVLAQLNGGRIRWSDPFQCRLILLYLKNICISVRRFIICRERSHRHCSVKVFGITVLSSRIGY